MRVDEDLPSPRPVRTREDQGGTYRHHKGSVLAVAGPNRFPTHLHHRIAHQVRIRRTEAGLSQEALAERAGLHRTHIGAIERGERNVSLATLEALARGLGCEPADLLRDKSAPT